MAKQLTMLVMILVLTSMPYASAQDWPQWLGASRDGQADFKAPTKWPAELTNKWTVVVGDGVATPALVGGKLYVFARADDTEVLRCLDAETGQEIWTDTYAVAGADGPARNYAGPRSSPTVAEGKVVTYGVRGTLSCVEAATGKLLWRKDSVDKHWPTFYTSSSPLIADGMCIAQMGGEQASVTAFNLSNGDLKWNWTGDGAAYASPALVNVDGIKAVVAETDKRIVAISLADGKLLWEKPYAGSSRMSLNTDTPLFVNGTLYYSGTGRGTTACRLKKDGAGFADTELWANPDNSVKFSTPVLKDNLFLGLSEGNKLFCINTKNGKTVWSKDIDGGQGFGSIVIAGSVAMALTPKGELIVFELDAAGFKPLASYKVAQNDPKAYPVASGNRIYVKDQDSLALWSVQE
ncbi:MAG: PQQ-like beta-propeller repeat protein [Phycisphaerae bacterium]|nr:PQQ-like beta-propeller repeat protein [Phycisphaerae bacterium]